MQRTVKFYSKNANDGKYAPYQYVGSVGMLDENMHTAELSRVAESIGGPIYGPLIAQVEGISDIWVIQV